MSNELSPEKLRYQQIREAEKEKALYQLKVKKWEDEVKNYVATVEENLSGFNGRRATPSQLLKMAVHPEFGYPYPKHKKFKKEE